MATNVPNPGNYFIDVATDLTSIRDTFRKLQDKIGYINSMGGIDFLTAVYPEGLGMSAPDGAALMATLNQHNDLAVHYTGGAQAPALNYMQNGEQFWGGR